MDIEPTTFESILKEELSSRLAKNSSYSLRAFARDLNVSPGFLSRLVSGKATPSESFAKDLAQRVGFKGEKLEWLNAVVDAQYSRDEKKRAHAVRLLSLYKKGVVSREVRAPEAFDWNWYHFAIRRLTHLSNFVSDPDWIANKLELSVEVVSQAIDELLRMGGLYVENKILKAPDNFVITWDPKKLEARKKMGQDLFQKIQKSVLTYDRKNSYHANHFFTLNQNQVDEVLQLIKSFEDQVDDITYRNDQHDRLYCLNLNFFGLLKIDD